MKVVDMHCDTILRLYDEGGNLLENEFNIENGKGGLFITEFCNVCKSWGKR